MSIKQKFSLSDDLINTAAKILQEKKSVILTEAEKLNEQPRNRLGSISQGLRAPQANQNRAAEADRAARNVPGVNPYSASEPSDGPAAGSMSTAPTIRQQRQRRRVVPNAADTSADSLNARSLAQVTGQNTNDTQMRTNYAIANARNNQMEAVSSTDARRSSIIGSAMLNAARKHMRMRKEDIEQVDEKLQGKQHKIDANKNNKIDAQDFELLRKNRNEEVEQVDEKITATDYEKEYEKRYYTPATDVRGEKKGKVDAAKRLARRGQGSFTDRGYGTTPHPRGIVRVHEPYTIGAGPKGRLPEEVEQVDEISKAYKMMLKYRKKKGNMKEEAQEVDATAAADARYHDCAMHVFHPKHGLGECVYSMHAEPDQDGNIAWYDVMFEHGIETQVPSVALNVLISEKHMNTHPSKMRKKKVSEQAELVDEAVHPMAVHVKPTDKSYRKFKVIGTGSDVRSVKKGDHVSSADLDDLKNDGHKIKEISEAVGDQYGMSPSSSQQMTMPQQANGQMGQDDDEGGEDDDQADYDYEGEMAKAQLMMLADHSIKLSMMIQDADDLEEWVQQKIAKAADYVNSVYNYMKYNSDNNGQSSQVMINPEMAKEQVELGEGRNPDQVTIMADKIRNHKEAHAEFMQKTGKEIPAKIINWFRNRHGDTIRDLYSKHFEKQKAAAAKDGDSDTTVAGTADTNELQPEKHIIAQLRQLADLKLKGNKKQTVTHHVTGKTADVEPGVAQYVLNQIDKMDPKKRQDHDIIGHLKDVQSKVDAKRAEMKKSQ